MTKEIEYTEDTYEVQNMPFSKMQEDPKIANWLNKFSIWDSLNEETIQLNDIQMHDVNLVLQKRYALLQWEQGSGKTLAARLRKMYHNGLAAGSPAPVSENEYSL